MTSERGSTVATIALILVIMFGVGGIKAAHDEFWSGVLARLRGGRNERPSRLVRDGMTVRLDIRTIALAVMAAVAVALVASNLHAVPVDLVIVELRVPLVGVVIGAAAIATFCALRRQAVNRATARERAVRRRDLEAALDRSRRGDWETAA